MFADTGFGLTSTQAAERLQSEGPNELPQDHRRGFVRQVWDVIREPILLLLIGAGALMCEANGFDPAKESHLREQMVELITITESFYACGVAASVYGKFDEHSRSMIALVTRFEGGGNLHDALHAVKPCVIPMVERLRILVEIATGLFHLHRAEGEAIIHGDIKSENVLFSGKGMQVRLADFGLSKVR